MKPVFLTAEWRKLIMANYEFSPAVLAPYLPARTVLDDFEGRCYVSLVGFLFDDVRLKGWRIPYHRQFPEVNLRFYVKRDIPGNPRSIQRGVVFINEIVPRFAIAWVANTVPLALREEAPNLCCPLKNFAGNVSESAVIRKR